MIFDIDGRHSAVSCKTRADMAQTLACSGYIGLSGQLQTVKTVKDRGGLEWII